MSTPALSTPRTDPTARLALDRAARTERPLRGPLTYTLVDALTAKRAHGRPLSTVERLLLALAGRAA